MKKFLDILLFTLLFFLIFSYFSGRDAEPVLDGSIAFNVSDNSYSVPAQVSYSINNNSRETILFDGCDDILLRKDGQEIALPNELCIQREIVASETLTVDLSAFYRLFEEPGNYVLQYTNNELVYQESFEVAYRGAIGQLFIGIFYAPVYNLLAYFISIFNNSLGFAIIAITIVIRILLLFPQHKMLVSQRKLQAIQPKIKKLQEKYKGQQQQMGMELMKLYKAEGVNPMGSCGLLLIQMPILLVIYNIILNITSQKNEFYLYDFLPPFVTSQIDYNFFNINLLEAGGIVGLILAIIVAAIQYIQVRLSLAGRPLPEKSSEVVLEKKQGEAGYSPMMPDPEMMNKLMLYGMPALVGVFTFTLIAGVGLYWGVSTLFAIFQQLFVNKIIKK